MQRQTPHGILPHCQSIGWTGLDDLVKSIGIPPRPSLLVDVQQEMAAADPDPRKITLSERAIQLYEGLNNHVEWEKGGELACEALNISNDEMANWCDELHVLFGEEN